MLEQLAQFYAVYGSVINFIGINALLALSLNVTLAAGMLSLGNAAAACRLFRSLVWAFDSWL